MELNGGSAQRQAALFAEPSEGDVRSELSHIPGKVSPFTDPCKCASVRDGFALYQCGSLDFVKHAAGPTVPPLEFLICAYLGALFLERSEAGESYEQQAAKLGTTKQTLMNLARGRTIGLRVLYHLAGKMFGGSIDAMNAEALRWWGKLDDEARSRVHAWASENEERRPTGSAKSDSTVSRPRHTGMAKPGPIEAPSRPHHEKQGRVGADRELPRGSGHGLKRR